MPYTNSEKDAICHAKKCLKPSRAIKKGERIYHGKNSGNDFHEACASEEFKQKDVKEQDDTNSKEGGEALQTPHASPPLEFKFDVKKNALDSKKFVHENWGDTDYSTGWIVAEVMRENYEIEHSNYVARSKAEGRKEVYEDKKDLIRRGKGM